MSPVPRRPAMVGTGAAAVEAGKGVTVMTMESYERAALRRDAVIDEADDRLRTVHRCEAPVRSGGGLRACDRPLDERGYCDRPSDHIE